MPPPSPKTRQTRPSRAPGRWTAASFAAFVATAAPAGAVDAVTTPGAGELTMCRSWIVYASCNTYHKVALPPRIAIGDTVTVTFGTNPKDYNFQVSRILQDGQSCKILSKASSADGEGERIEITQCQPADQPAGEATEQKKE